MITQQQWSSLQRVKRSWFKYPDNLDWSIVSAFDRFAVSVGVNAQVISDYRPGDPRQHGQGRAIDSVWAGLDPLAINSKALASGLFSGVGIYSNEQGVASHHFDTRTDRTTGNPAVWGGLITHPFDPEKNSNVKTITYVGMAQVVDFLKKSLAKPGTLIILALFAFVIWLVTQSRS